MQLATTSLMLLLSAAAIAGCASYSDIHGEEHPMSARALAFEKSDVSDGVFVQGDWPRADWWATFGDSKLDALVSEALANNPGLHAVEARVRAADSLVQTARSTLFPILDLDAGAARERLSGHDITYGPYAGSWINQGSAMLDFNYEFDFWGKNRRTLVAALGEARAAEAGNAAARLVLASAVAQTYFRMQTDIAAADVERQTLVERENLRDLNLQRVGRGLETTIPVRQSEQQVASSHVGVSAAEASVQLDRHQLAALLGLGPDTAFDVQPALQTHEDALALPADVPADLLARRPDIAALRFHVEAAAARVGAAKADFYPNINLAAFVGVEALTLHGLDLFDAASRTGGASPAIHLPLFEGGRLQAGLRGRYAEYDSAVAEYNLTLVAALHQVADQIVNLRAVRRQLIDQAAALAAASDACRLTLDRYRAGLTNYLDVLVNEEKLLAERQRQIQLQGEALTQTVETIRALGGGYRAPKTTSAGI